MSDNRFLSLMSLIQKSSLDAVLVNPGPTLRYLTDLEFHLMERPTVLLVNRSGESAMIIPELESIKLAHSRIQSRQYTFGDNPAERVDAFRRACTDLGLSGGKVGVEPTRIRFLEMDYLSRSCGNIDLVGAEDLFLDLRLRKDAEETGKMKKAVSIAQEALTATLPMIHSGTSEKSIASELVVQLLRHGADAELPFPPIVSAGENGANPHATPSERILREGDLVVVDWGCFYEGYASDLTRTFAIGKLDAELTQIHQIVQTANAAARSACQPGVSCGSIDSAAREVIGKAGYGEQFNHRVGHGLGMEAHEEPYMFNENLRILEPGMTFTIEPGIYLTGRGGVRIEDNMVITAAGADCLSDLPRELITLS